MLTALGRFDEAAGEVEFVVGVVEKIWGETHPNVFTSRLQLGRIRGWQGRYDEGRALLDHVLETATAIPAIRDRAIANTCQSIAHLELERGDLDAAMRNAERAIPAWAAVFGEDNYRTWKARGTLARVHLEAGRLTEAEEILRAAIENHLEEIGGDHNTTLGEIEILADCLLRQGRASEAEKELRPLIARRASAQGPLFPQSIYVVAQHARCLLALGQTSEALILAEEAVRRASEIWSPGEPSAAILHGTLGLCRGGEAGERALLDAYGTLDVAFGAANPRTRAVARWLSDHYASRGMVEQSQAWGRR